MGAPKKEKPTFGATNVEPKMLTREESARLVLEATEMLQRVERDYQGRDVVEREVKHDRPVRVVTAADLHALSISTDNRAIIELKDSILADPDTAVVLLGDEVEGIKAAYLDTNRTPVDFHQQIDWLRTVFLEPLAKANRVLCMVSGYWGHPGWASDATTINTWRMMTDGLDIPLLRNGGILRLRFPNGNTHELQVWHNPPKASEMDAVFGLRAEALTVSAEERADGFAAAHIHRAGVAKELYPGNVQTYYISTGTLKGSSTETPRDVFGTKLGRGRTSPLEQGVVVQPMRKGKGERSYPYPSNFHGEVVHGAMRVLDATERQGLTKELLGQISHKVESAPKVFLVEKLSAHSTMTFEDQGIYKKRKLIRPYGELAYDVRTQLPIALHLIAKARLGCNSEGEKPLQRYLEQQVIGHPHDFVTFLGNMIDKDAGKSPERQDVLDRFVEIINSTKPQTLGVMMDSCLRGNSWKNDIFVGVDEDEEGKKHKVFEEPIPPGTYISERTGVPLYHHLSLIKLMVGPKIAVADKPLYVGGFADHLERSGSYSRPTFGLMQLYRLQMHKHPTYMAGGHMPSVGSSFWDDDTNQLTRWPFAISTGWFASAVDTMGKGNVRPGAEPGQAVIFLPGLSQADALAFPTTNAEETEYLHDALMLMQGLKILGLTEKVLTKKGR